MKSEEIYRLLQPLGLKPLHKTWAKIEIILGLTCAFLGMMIVFARDVGIQLLVDPDGERKWLTVASGLLLFVLGGYLAMAGHRSHLYQSSNQATAFLNQEIRNRDGEMS